ncbi:MAG TPA: CBS domain-containing protein [Candidatus Limnocylindrales bacterium]|nr:CBS domain-containing protein [Candidatus Limnocylindrales bacterium]
MASLVFAGDVYSKGFNSVQESDTLSRCLEVFEKGMPPVLAVLNDKGKYQGVITRRSIIRSRLEPGTTKVRTIMKAAPPVSVDLSLSKVAKLMIESGVRELPVFEKNKLLGFITDENIIHAAVMREWGNDKIETIMTKAPHTLEADRSTGAVLSLMREYGISHVPIMERGKLVGMVGIQDILETIYWPQRRQTTGEIVGEKIETLSVPARGVVRRPVITVEPETSLRNAEKVMHDDDVSCLAVTSKEHLVGVVTKRDFLEPISQLEVAERKLTVQFSLKDLDVTPQQQAFMMEEFDSFSRRYQDAFQLGTLFVYMKSHGNTNLRGIPLIHCRLQFRTTRGTFFSASEGWGIEPTFRVGLDRLDRRLLRSKELLAYNPRYARDYLRKIGLPQEEP